MNVLVTGSSGRVGRHVVTALTVAGYDVDGFDLVTGDDVRDVSAVRAAVHGVDGVVHLAAVPDEAEGDGADLMATNVTGTWNLLGAASEAGVGRFVFASSVNALGVFLGRRAPDYLPIDDDHPCYGTSPYGVSKHLGEELCALTARTTGLSAICLRIPRVVEPHEYAVDAARYTESHGWEYGAFIDVRDLAEAIVRAVEVPGGGCERVLIGSSDAMAVTPPVQVADRRLPGVPWTARAEFEAANVGGSPPPRPRVLASELVRKVRAARRERR